MVDQLAELEEIWKERNREATNRLIETFKLLKDEFEGWEMNITLSPLAEIELKNYEGFEPIEIYISPQPVSHWYSVLEVIVKDGFEYLIGDCVEGDCEYCDYYKRETNECTLEDRIIEIIDEFKSKENEKVIELDSARKCIVSEFLMEIKGFEGYDYYRALNLKIDFDYPQEIVDFLRLYFKTLRRIFLALLKD